MLRSYDQQGLFQCVTFSKLEMYQLSKFSVLARAGDEGTETEINTETSVCRTESSRGQIFLVGAKRLSLLSNRAPPPEDREL